MIARGQERHSHDRPIASLAVLADDEAKELEAKLRQDIEIIEGEREVRYVTSVERLATERGMQIGLEKGLERGRLEGEGAILRRLLTHRFGPLPQDVLERLAHAGSQQLETWAERVIDASSLDKIFADN